MKSLLQFLGFMERPPTDPAETVVADGGTLLGPRASLKGELRGDGPLAVLGQFEGEIVLTGMVHVGADAHVDANITAGDITIAGVVRGNLLAAGRVEILPTGSLTGTLKSGSLAAENGARVKGEVWIQPAAGSEGTPQ